MYRTVLVPLDLGREADRALPVGAALASRFGAPLDVVSVGSPGLPPGVEETEVRAHARSVGVVLDGVRLRYDEDVAAGVLSEVAAADGLLCCATHARGHVADRFFHSMSGRLLRGSRGPLVLVGPDVPPTPPHIAQLLVCVDGGPYEDVLAATTAWARALSVSAHVLQVTDPDLPQPFPTAELVAEQLEANDITATWELVPDERPADAIVDCAAKLDGPLIVVGTNDRTAERSAGLGRVSLAVVHRAAYPVVVVPPETVVA